VKSGTAYAVAFGWFAVAILFGTGVSCVIQLREQEHRAEFGAGFRARSVPVLMHTTDVAIIGGGIVGASMAILVGAGCPSEETGFFSFIRKADPRCAENYSTKLALTRDRTAALLRLWRL